MNNISLDTRCKRRVPLVEHGSSELLCGGVINVGDNITYLYDDLDRGYIKLRDSYGSELAHYTAQELLGVRGGALTVPTECTRIEVGYATLWKTIECSVRDVVYEATSLAHLYDILSMCIFNEVKFDTQKVVNIYLDERRGGTDPTPPVQPAPPKLTVEYDGVGNLIVVDTIPVMYDEDRANLAMAAAIVTPLNTSYDGTGNITLGG